MGIVFITADVEGTLINSHKLPIQPIFDILVQQGYTCKWGQWRDPWGANSGIPDDEIDCYVTGDMGIPNDERKLKSKIFYHTHGLHPIEKGYASSKVWYGYLSPGKYWYNTVNRHGEIIHEESTNKGLNPEGIPVTGWAKMDVLFNKTKEEIISEYNLKLPYEKTVLYAPAGNWDYATSFDNSIEHILNLFSKLPYNLIIKNAVYSGSFKKWEYFMEAMRNPPSNITTIMAPERHGTASEAAQPDITPLYQIADILITDGSSVAWEFIGVDKPSIQLTNMSDPASSLAPLVCHRHCDIETKPDGLRYKSEFGKSTIVNDYPECRGCGGIIKTSLEDLEPTINEAIETPDLYARERRIWAKLVNEYVDGKCAQRCVDAIKRIANI